MVLVLDSASVYRVEPADGRVLISPRQLSQPFPFERGSLYGEGRVIRPRFTGEYRIDTYASEDGVVQVRIFREDGDQAELRCIRRPLARGCVGDAWAHGRIPLGFLLMVLSFPTVTLLMGLDGLGWR